MRWIAAMIFLLAGCGRLFYGTESTPDGGAGGGDGAAGSDAALGPFSTPVPIGELSDAVLFEDDPSLTGDMLEIYFNRGPDSNAGTVWRSTRRSIDDLWDEPMIVGEIDTGSSFAGSPEVSPDGKFLYVAAIRAGGMGNTDLYFTSRASRGETWGPLQALSVLNSADGDACATEGGEGKRLVFNRNTASGDQNLWESTRATTSDPWGEPAPIAELNTADNEACGFLASSGLELYFYSNRGGLPSIDLFRSTRPALDAPFETPEPVAELNSEFRDEDPWLSPDGRTIYFARDGELVSATR